MNYKAHSQPRYDRALSCSKFQQCVSMRAVSVTVLKGIYINNTQRTSQSETEGK